MNENMPAQPGAPGNPAPVTTGTEPPAPPPPRILPAKKSPRSWSFWLAIFLAAGLALSLFINMLLAAVVGGGGSGAGSYLQEVVESGGPAKVVLIEVEGILMDSAGGLFGGGPSIVDSTIKQLREASKDDSVKAIVLAVNSPGGGVSASDMLWNEVKKTRDAGKKVVVFMGELCASGGYYLSAPADRIVASPTTLTGSIGVILTHMEHHELEKYVGVKMNSIKSGPHKDILSGSRKMTEEERQILTKLVERMYERFVDIVIEGRKGKGKFPEAREDVKKIADGRIYTGQEAVELGLADQTGYLEDAVTEARKLAGAPNATLIKYTRPPSLLSALLGAQGERAVNINTGVQIDASRLLEAMTPRLEYRWQP